MKAKKIDITGFRGFNERREIEFDDTLTLIAAHNSYGKTSITEAFEFLIYGQTSKVQSADSKDEYKGSYRNVHLPENENPRISLTMSDGGTETLYTVELRGNDIVRFVNGKEVESFPFAPQVDETVRPFILQHALKDLLLSTPKLQTRLILSTDQYSESWIRGLSCRNHLRPRLRPPGRGAADCRGGGREPAAGERSQHSWTCGVEAADPLHRSSSQTPAPSTGRFGVILCRYECQQDRRISRHQSVLALPFSERN